MKQVKIGFAVLAAIAATAAVGACGGGEGTEAGGTVTGGSAPAPESAEGGGSGAATAETIVVRNGEPVGGVAELEYAAGEEVRFRVRSDVADEIHVHGYDVSKDVPAGGAVSFDFPADIEGIFEVELEDRQEQIAELRVNP